jgi:drug/metabolite transporter (DMT)-like permease
MWSMKNIHAAPTANLNADDNEEIKKPKSAWLVQLLALVMLGLISFGFISGIRRSSSAFPIVSWKLLLFVALVIYLLATVIRLHRRHPWGRVLGLILIGFTGLLVFISAQTLQLVEARGKSEAHYFVLAVTGIAFVYWGYAFGYSRRARRYFGRPAPKLSS